MKNLIPWKNKQSSTTPSLWNDTWEDSLWSNPFGSILPSIGQTFSARLPSVDVKEDKNEYTVRAEVPGMNERDLDLSWQDGVLRIRGEKKAEREEKKKDHYYRECSYGTFSRDVPLGDSVDWKRAQAKYRNGVLTVKLPKSEQARKSIEVKVH